jgi:hypothetical protein
VVNAVHREINDMQEKKRVNEKKKKKKQFSEICEKSSKMHHYIEKLSFSKYDNF